MIVGVSWRKVDAFVVTDDKESYHCQESWQEYDENWKVLSEEDDTWR